jgi:valyl-tRNA synthetase
MRTRYENWVTGLNGDWLISRQRFFGVPLPVWYPLDGAGERDHSRPIVPAESALPVDPSSDTPPGFTEAQRDVPGGFTAETDIMDTWATSSLTPEIVGGWERDPELWALVHPMHLRPQAHEIIRTWLFATMLRSHALHGELPWRHAAISGWILDPDRKKMSKSKGNAAKADSPEALLQRFGPDALRYWAASARPGADTALSPAQMKVGRRLATKVLNAGRFVHELGGGSELGDAAVTEALDRAMLARLAEVVESATSALEDFDSARALERIESFFWTFCDDYLELVKERAYGDGAAETSAPRDSARAALRLALDVQLRLLAPFLPFAAEEVWSWSASSPATPASPARSATPASIHLAPWPAATELRAAAPVPADSALLATASELIGAVRRAKAEAQLSMRAPLRSAVLSGTAEALDAVRGFLPDLRATGRIEELELLPSPEAAALRIEVRA